MSKLFNVIAVLFLSCGMTGVWSWAAEGWSGPLPEFIQGEKKKSGEVLLENVLSDDDSECFGKKCMYSDHCCKGSVCVDVDGSKLGTCLPLYGQREGETCQQDSECEQGLHCQDSSARGRRVCQPQARELHKKQFNDECQTSNECDVTKGLCCQLQRRHRMAPRKLCYYFSDPKSCIGEVDAYNAKPITFISNPLFRARIG